LSARTTVEPLLCRHRAFLTPGLRARRKPVESRDHAGFWGSPKSCSAIRVAKFRVSVYRVVKVLVSKLRLGAANTDLPRILFVVCVTSLVECLS